MAKSFIYHLEKFLGLHTATDSQRAILGGESPEMVNFRITDGWDLKKREGFFSLATLPDPIRGIWTGAWGDGQMYLLVSGDTLYRSHSGFDALSAVEGSVPGEGKVFLLPFYDAIYLLTGEGILRFADQEVRPLEPYVPTVMISTPPDGAGVMYEEPNLLTDRVLQRFSPDGEHVKFKAALTEIRSISRVTVDGEDLERTEYAWHSTSGILELANPPKAGIDSMEVEFCLPENEVAQRILGCRYGLAFGGANDTRVFVYGNPDAPAMRYHSGVVDGKPCFGYFPETGYTMIGSGAPITSILRHYDRQLIFTPDAAYYSYLEYMTGEGGKLIAAFPTLPLSDDRGNDPMGQALLVENTPCTLTDSGLYFWISTNIRDERNAKCISDSIARALKEERSEKALLFNRKATSELYLAVEGHLYVYNYRLKVFYYYETPVIDGFCEGEDGFYFASGNVMYQVGGETDDGREIVARWESGPLDFSDHTRNKTLFRLSLYGQTQKETELNLEARAENERGEEVKTVRFPSGKEFSLGVVRLPMRKVRLLRLFFEVRGAGDFLLRSLRIKGRITDQSDE